ncbi:MAG: hypothetical protein ACYC7A_21150 [Thermoanaerobaculia bacterium]
MDDGPMRQRIAYIVMEYLDGESLAARIARGALLSGASESER